jgi:general secretion pathway protein G
MTTRKNRNHRRGGFTLVEVLLVLVILVIIAGLAATNLIPMEKRGKINAARTQIRAFKGPLGAYRLDIGDYPTSLEELRMPPADAAAADRWAGPYLDRNVPLDPWDRPYGYRYPGQHDPDMPDIWSAGPDKVEGTQDDIASWGPD